MTPQLDIHNYPLKYKRAKEAVERASISPINKSLIKQFEQTCTLEGLSIPRRLKLMGSLIIIARDYLKKDFRKATKQDIKDVVLTIDNSEKYSAWTKQSYRAILKKFYKWLEYGDDYIHKPGYPEIINWINTNLKYKDKPRINAADILTEEEIMKMIGAAEYPRDKAFIAMLYELGARIGELGNLNIRHVSRDRYSYLIDLTGKTGRRTPRIVISDPYLTEWLNGHPLKNQPDSPLWILSGNRDRNKKMLYAALRALVLRLKKKAGLKKRLYPHLFRHSRVTHLLLNKQINEAQAKVYFGWTPSSKMLSEYSHLVSSDVNDTILEIHGIKTAERKESKLQPKQCPKCQEINTNDGLFCRRCGSILDMKTALAIDQEREKQDEKMTQLIEELLKSKEGKQAFLEAVRKMAPVNAV